MVLPLSPTDTAEPSDADGFGGDLDDRRRRARCSARDRLELTGLDPDSRLPRVAVVPFAPGAAVVALGGTFDRAGVEILRGMGDEIDRAARDELVVDDMARVLACDEAVARVVARWRIRRLAAGARVELHDAPPAVRVELGQHPTPF